MKFCECIGDMAKGASAIKDDVERTLVTREEMSIIEELHWADNWTQLKPFDSIDFDEEGWEIKVETWEVCGVEFTRQPDNWDGEVTWVSETRGLRLSRGPHTYLWRCWSFDRGGPMLLGVSDEKAAAAVLDVLDQAEKVTTTAARVLGKEAAGWQPIETAPMNKPVLLCWAGEDGDPEVAKCVKVAGDGTWATPRGYHPRNPTYWMPIPPLPGVHDQTEKAAAWAASVLGEEAAG